MPRVLSRWGVEEGDRLVVDLSGVGWKGKMGLMRFVVNHVV